MSHNLVDITGAGGRGYNLAPSISGAVTLQLESSGGSNWAATVTALAYTGQANALQTMNQFLVTPGSPATTSSAFNVDGVGNSGQWTASAANNWTIQYTLDFYFATSADGDPSPTDIDATFDNTTIAFTTQALAAAPQVLSLHFSNGQHVLRFTGSAGQAYEILHSENMADWQTIAQPTLTYPEAGMVEWTDANPPAERQFYRVRVLTP